MYVCMCPHKVFPHGQKKKKILAARYKFHRQWRSPRTVMARWSTEFCSASKRRYIDYHSFCLLRNTQLSRTSQMSKLIELRRGCCTRTDDQSPIQDGAALRARPQGLAVGQYTAYLVRCSLAESHALKLRAKISIIS